MHSPKGEKNYFEGLHTVPGSTVLNSVFGVCVTEKATFKQRPKEGEGFALYSVFQEKHFHSLVFHSHLNRLLLRSPGQNCAVWTPLSAEEAGTMKNSNVMIA